MAGFFKIITRSALAYYMYVLNTTILNKNACALTETIINDKLLQPIKY